MQEYPRFEVRVYGGRLPVPPQYRGTSIAKQIKTGRLGGRAVKERRQFADSVDEGRALQHFLRCHNDVEIDYVKTPRDRRNRLTRSAVFHPRFLEQSF